MVAVASRSLLRAALENTNGTVTNYLEELVGEGIVAEFHDHLKIVAPASNDLEAAEGEPLLLRHATLRGRRSGSAYVYAESIIVTNRLPPTFFLRLESSTDPIGRILDELGIATSRTNLDRGRVAASRPNGAKKVGDYLLGRTYRLDSERIPLMVITEWFLKTLTPFLSRGI